MQHRDDSTIYSGPSPQDLDCIPADLKTRSQWVLWRGADRIDQQTGEVTGLEKIPIDPQTLRHASTTDSETWGTFAYCVEVLPVALEEWHTDDPGAYRGGGLGYVFSHDDPYAGVDLDHCRNPMTGVISDWAQAHIDALASYTEVTPSGTGVHILVRGALPPRGRKKGPTEMYNYARFFTMTGWHLAGIPPTIKARQKALATFHSTIFGAPQPTHKHGAAPQATSAPLLEDIVLLDKARTARNGAGARFTTLWSGDLTGYPSQSEADLALCIRLAFWTQDSAQIDRLFRQSGLLRDKWDEKRSAQTYGERTIMEALARQTERYQMGEEAQHRRNGQAPDTRGQNSATTGDTTLAALPAGDPAVVLDTVSPCTHVANARRIAREYADRLHYVLGRGWILWTGEYWRTDPTAEGALATGFVSGLARTIAREAATLLEQAAQELDSDRRVALMKLADARLKWAVQSENERVITAGLKLAKRALLIEHRAIDTDPWLFNCQNGTLDLHTGTRRDHNPEDLITHIAPVTFDPNATCPAWEQFLSQVFAGDTKMVHFIQRAIGWSLTGVVQDRALFFLYGPKGHNGKTTLVETVRDLLGDCGEDAAGYARKVDVGTFMKQKNFEDTQRKTATLAGPRFVYSSEVDEEHRLNEQLIKDITGGDTLEGRRLYREAFTFKPTFKPWIYGNHKPEIRGTDDALWSRVKLVPFEVSFADRVDLKLPEKLRAELPGILNWAIQGCLDWQRVGLQPPEKVKTATQKYRMEQNVIAQFIQDCCVVLPAASIKAKRLYEAYITWCGENGHEALNHKRFGAYLTTHDFPSDDNATGRGAIRSGIDLLEPPANEKSATHRGNESKKGSSTESQQRRAENDTPEKNATHATPQSGKSLTKSLLEGVPGISGSMGSMGSTTLSDDSEYDEGVI